MASGMRCNAVGAAPHHPLRQRCWLQKQQ